MGVSVGARVGPYEVLARIGAGGMGEVYRARDVNLKREVALKVLPSAVAGDPDRLSRFEREAEILASLNHPGIAAIYGMVEQALVMELVEGQTLPCPVPVATAIDYAGQIAEAIEYAHERGVIHRDLKPANILVTPEGAVKILDFGLAKALDDRPPSGARPEDSPTFTMGATSAGMILGTAAYMSPEQAVGKTADRRSDIFSFGAVLYEMLAGKSAFPGDSVGEILAAVVKDQPDWAALPAATPSHVRKLLERALVKDRRQRLQAIGEARIALEHGEAEPAPPRKPTGSRFLWPAAVVILGGALIVAALLHSGQPAASVAALNATLLPPEGAEFDFGVPSPLPALSPDGTSIVFGARLKGGKTQLWLRRLDSPVAHPLPRTEGSSFPFWSPDSRWIGFGQGNKLKKIDAGGGPPVVLADLPTGLRGASWSSQGVIVFCLNTQPIMMKVPAGGGTPIDIDAVDKDRKPEQGRYPWFLPDGRHFLYTASQYGDLPIRVGSLDKPGEPGKVVAQAESNVIYAQGHLLYLRENTLMAQPFDTTRLETTGGPIAVADGVPTFLQPSRAAGFTASVGGLLVYQGSSASGPFRLVWKDRTGKTLGTIAESPGRVDGIALSPDGKSLAASIQDPSGNLDIWTFDVAHGSATRFTIDPAADRDPVWTRDGNSIYFRSNRRGPSDLFRKAANGTGAEDLVLEDSVEKIPTSFSPDGKLLLFSRAGRNTEADIWVLPLPSKEGAPSVPRVFLDTPSRENAAQFSPDGQWIAYQSNETGLSEVYVAAFPGPGGKRQISSGGASKPRWRRDGRELFYLTSNGQLMAAAIDLRKGTVEPGETQKLFEGVFVELRAGVTYDVSPDGQKFIVIDNNGNTAAPPLTLLQNWTALLRQKGPAAPNPR